jgi:quercetin dioxygenase-like cupin family protein
MAQGILLSEFDRPPEYWQDPSRGSLAWKTLFSADQTGSNSLVCGVAIMQAGDFFALHSHPQAEIYFGLEGEVDVYIDGTLHRLKSGSALFIPGGAVHGVPHADGPVKWFYTFAADSFDEIAYSFLPK